MTTFQALMPALVYLLAQLCGNVHRLGAKPIVVGTLTGLLLGDVKTGAILGAELEIMYLGVISVGGVQATDAGFATCFAVALAICTGISSEAAIAIGIPAGMIGNFLGTFRMMFFSLFVGYYDKLFAEDKTSLYEILHWVIAIVGHSFGAIAMFIGLRTGASALANFMETTPVWVTTGLNAAGAMLPAVGMAILLNYLWQGNLVIYMIFGFCTMAFLPTSNLYMAILGLTFAIADFYRNREIAKLKKGAVSEEEEFF